MSFTQGLRDPLDQVYFRDKKTGQLCDHDFPLTSFQLEKLELHQFKGLHS